MSGYSTYQRLAILDTKNGINIDTYENMKDLAEHAVRNAHGFILNDEQARVHIEWLENLCVIIKAEIANDFTNPNGESS